MATDDSMDDDVFEEDSSARLRVVENDVNQRTSTPSPTGYRDYKPPAEVLRLCETDAFDDTVQTIHKVGIAHKMFVVELI